MASNISDDDDMILLMYGESFDRRLYREWSRGNNIVHVTVPFAVPVSRSALAHLSDGGVKARLSPSYLNDNFASWQRTSVAAGAPTLPTLESTLVSSALISIIYSILWFIVFAARTHTLVCLYYR